MEFNNLHDKLRYIGITEDCISNTHKYFQIHPALRQIFEIHGTKYDFASCNNAYPPGTTDVAWLIQNPLVLDRLVDEFEKCVINPNKYKQIKKQEDMAESTKKTTKVSTFEKMKDKFKSIYLPVKEKDLSITFDGVICTKFNDEYVGFDKDNQLINYPEEMMIDMPMYSILKPISQIKNGDIIKIGDTFLKVINTNKTESGQISVISFYGGKQCIKETKDFLINKSLFRVIINFNDFSFMNNSESEEGDMSMNPIMLMAMMDNKDKSQNSMIEAILMSQMMSGQGVSMFNENINPNLIMMMMLKGKDDGDKNDMLQLMLLSQMMNKNSK